MLNAFNPTFFDRLRLHTHKHTMPAVPNNSKILVTSGSGFVGSWVVNVALREGYQVRTTVRNTKKGEYLDKLFTARYGPGKFEYIVVADLEDEGAFDEAVKDVAAVLHTGSPFYTHVDGDPDSLIKPAVNGTRNVLGSVLSHGSGVKRVVITSSNAAITNRLSAPTKHTVEDWNTYSPAAVEKDPLNVPGIDAYCASKTLAERAAWDFVAKHKPTWDLVTVNPVMVYGPIIHQVAGADPASLNTSSKALYNFLQGKVEASTWKEYGGNAVDVRDVAAAHVLAIEKEEAGNNRFPAVYAAYSWQQFADAVHSSPVILDAIKNKVSKGDPTKGQTPDKFGNSLDRTKSEEVLGITFHDLREQVDSAYISFADYEKRNWEGIPDLKLLDL